MRDLVEKLNTADEPPQPPPEPPPQREFGSVVWFREDRGFGFICPEDAAPDSGEDVWVHISSVLSGEVLQPAQRVSYVRAIDRRGRKKASDVKVEFGAE